MFTGCRDHISVLIFLISYFLSAFVSFFSLQTVPYVFFLLSAPLIFSPVRMMMKMMTNFQSLEYTKRLCILALSCVLHYRFLFTTRQLFSSILSCWVSALARVYSIYCGVVWTWIPTKTLKVK